MKTAGLAQFTQVVAVQRDMRAGPMLAEIGGVALGGGFALHQVHVVKATSDFSHAGR